MGTVVWDAVTSTAGLPRQGDCGKQFDLCATGLRLVVAMWSGWDQSTMGFSCILLSVASLRGCLLQLP